MFFWGKCVLFGGEMYIAWQRRLDLRRSKLNLAFTLLKRSIVTNVFRFFAEKRRNNLARS